MTRQVSQVDIESAIEAARATWAIGLLAGINLLSTGISFIVLALERLQRRRAPGVPIFCC
jgi:hypothetical protein